MSRNARLYIYSVILTGLMVIGYGSTTWRSNNPTMLVIYLFITMLESGLKVSLPGVTGTMSVWFLFVLIGFTELSFAETLVLGCGAALVQCFWHARRTRPRAVQVTFNLSAVAAGIVCRFRPHADRRCGSTWGCDSRFLWRSPPSSSL